MDNLCIGACLA